MKKAGRSFRRVPSTLVDFIAALEGKHSYRQSAKEISASINFRSIASPSTTRFHFGLDFLGLITTLTGHRKKCIS